MTLLSLPTRQPGALEQRVILVCGAQGGESRSIQFFADHGVDYVSCALSRLVVARLAAAQAAGRLDPRTPPQPG